MVEKISIEQPPPTLTLPRQDFVPEDFSSLIYQKGYNVYHESAILCPCKAKGSDNSPSCQNCGGSGWVFLNKIKTKMLLFSQNLETKYKEWSEEKIGNVSISCDVKDQLSFMDRLTLIDSDSIHSQMIYPILYQDRLFSYLNYNVLNVIDCYLFINDNSKLKRLKIEDSDFTVENNIFYLNKKYYTSPNTIIRISLRYRHQVAYHVIDITRDIITSDVRDDLTGRIIPTKLPLSGMGRRAHYILDPSKFSGTYILDNTY